jgi:trimethylamine---corrinoid protein Co-methyltransferase
MQYAEFLSPQEIIQVHEKSLEILETVGIQVRNERARNIYSAHGCPVDSKTDIVKIPGKVVENHRKSFAPTFTFHGRDPKFDRTLPHDGPVLVTGSSAPNVIDPVTGKERRSTSRDIANIAYLINELPGFDVFSISTLADDAPADCFSISRFYPALKNCLKPVRGNTPDVKELKQVIEMGEIIAGGAEAYAERPIITHHCCPVVSPLTMDVESTDIIIYLTEKGLPVYGTIVPNAGMTSPMTLAATLALGNAEFLALAVLREMIRPGSPNIYAVLSTVADMRSGAYAPGAIETGMLLSGHSQMARFYGVPSGGYIGLTNAHVNDAQSGYETGMNTTGSLLAGASMFNMGGLLGSLMAFDFSKAVIDSEIGLMLKQLKKGYTFTSEDFCMDLIADIGPGGNYMESMHTYEKMRTTAVLPTIANRQMRVDWEAEGALDAGQRAMNQAREILMKENPAVLPTAVDQKIRAHFTDLVPGNAGWSV